MSTARPLTRVVMVRPSATATERAHVRAWLIGLRSRYVVAAEDVHDDADGFVVRYEVPANARTLASRLGAGRGLGLPEAVRLAVDVAWGLAAGTAAGVLHGRLDATQVVLGDGPARVLGLGLATLDAAPPPAGDGIAPEVRAGGPPTEAADLWSLGVLLRDLTAGDELPLKLADLLTRMLDTHPSRRPASARAVAARLVGMRIAAPHVDPGPRRAAAKAVAAPSPAALPSPAAPTPPARPEPTSPAPPSPEAPSPEPLSPAPPPPASRLPAATVLPAPMPQVSALRRTRPTSTSVPPLAPPGVGASEVAAPEVNDPVGTEPPSSVAATEQGTRARAGWRRRQSARPDEVPPAPAAPVPRPAARAEPVSVLPAPVASAPVATRGPQARRPLLIAVALAVLIAAGILVVLATRGSSAPHSGAAPAPTLGPVTTSVASSPSPHPLIPLPIVAATAPVDPVAVARLRALALRPSDVAAQATPLAVPEQSNFDAVLRALYADCDYFTPVDRLPLAHRFVGYVDGDVEIFDDLTTYPTGVAAQVVQGVATAITKCPTIAVSSDNASEAPATFAVTRADPPAGVPTDSVALTYERTDQVDDHVRAVFLSTGTTLRVVLALAPSLAQSEEDWNSAAAHAWQRLTGSS